MHAFPELVIGVTTRRGDPAWVSANTQNYLNILADYGAKALILAPDTPVRLAGERLFSPDEAGRLPAPVLDYLDGVIFSGGGMLTRAISASHSTARTPTRLTTHAMSWS